MSPKPQNQAAVAPKGQRVTWMVALGAVMFILSLAGDSPGYENDVEVIGGDLVKIVFWCAGVGFMIAGFRGRISR